MTFAAGFAPAPATIFHACATELPKSRENCEAKPGRIASETQSAKQGADLIVTNIANGYGSGTFRQCSDSRLGHGGGHAVFGQGSVRRGANPEFQNRADRNAKQDLYCDSR